MTKKIEVVPEHLKQYSTDSVDDIKGEQRPVLKLLHKNTEEGDIGEFYIEDEMRNLGSSAEIIIVHHDIVWRLYNSSLEFVAQSKTEGVWDNGSAMTEEEVWKNKNIDIYVLTKGSPMPKRFTFKGTSFGNGLELLKSAKRLALPIFAKKYTLKSNIIKGKLSYAVAAFSIGDFCNEDECKSAAIAREAILDALDGNLTKLNKLKAQREDDVKKVEAPKSEEVDIPETFPEQGPAIALD